MNKHLFACLACLVVAGCRTPQVALDEANHGLSLTSQLTSELAAYAARQSAIDEMRKQQLGQYIKTYNERLLSQPADDQLYEISGQGQQLAVMKHLRSRVALLRGEAETRAANNTRLAELESSLVTALPPVGTTLGATGRAFGALGTELPLSERAAIATSFSEDVAKEVRKNKEAASATSAKEVKALPANDSTTSVVTP